MSEAVLDPPIALAPHVTLAHYARASGMTVKAMEHKIARGEWLEGQEYHRRDGRIYVDVKGVSAWVVRGRA